MQIYIYLHIYIYMYVCMCVYIYIYIYVYTFYTAFDDMYIYMCYIYLCILDKSLIRMVRVVSSMLEPLTIFTNRMRLLSKIHRYV